MTDLGPRMMMAPRPVARGATILVLALLAGSGCSGGKAANMAGRAGAGGAAGGAGGNAPGEAGSGGSTPSGGNPGTGGPAAPDGAPDGAAGETAPTDGGALDAAQDEAASAARPVIGTRAADPDFAFDTTISQAVLERYLNRSISFTQLLQDDITQPVNDMGVDPLDNLRMLFESKAKFIGRAVFVWGAESNLATFLQRAKPFADRVHQADPDIVLQAAAFEIVTTQVQGITIPPAVLTEFAQPAQARTFDYSKMLFPNGKFANNWGNGASVPDMSQLETRMWFYYLATSYIDVGAEAIHFGQVSLMDQNDPGHVGWFDMLGRVRAYAHQHARRHMVLCDAHTPTGGIVEGGKLLFDSHAFPLRIEEVAGQPFKGQLRVGYADSIYTKSKGGITPSGWSCAHLPYMVEFDNFGRSNPGQSSSAPFIWGWDEITWFATQTEPDRNAWLQYAWQWLPAHDPVGHLEMPGSRVLSPGPEGGPKWYWANTKSAACPTGFNTEDTIRALWAGGPVDAGM